MSAEVLTTLSHVAAPRRTRTFADAALRSTARLWLAVTIFAELVFAFTVAAFYGTTALRGNWQAWNRFMTHGHTAGHPMDNAAAAMHVASAFVVLVAGALQMIPSLRSRFPAVHRWNGRFFMLAAVALTTGGLYMHWVSGSVGDLPQRLGSTLNAVLIWVCAAQALRYAVAREIATHRRWAMRLFLVVSASFFFRVGFFLTLMIARGPIGFDPNTFTGPLPTIMSFAQYLVPLAILEVYFFAQSRPGAGSRLAMSALFVLLTIVTIGGSIGVGGAIWLKQLRIAFDSRTSIAQLLADTIEAKGVDAAVAEYVDLKSRNLPSYNFDENQLNTVGYQLLHGRRVYDAIRVFELNARAYPKSSNSWDSLGEGYLAAGDRAMAIASYTRAVQLDPHNESSKSALRKLRSRG